MVGERVYEPIPAFYAGKSVLITGGAGYLGKVLIEKLLYSCPDVDTVYVLLRDKKNDSAEKRLQNILNLPLFSRLPTERHPALVLLKGDIRAQNLNLSTENLKTVMEKVSVVIHTAAVVKFNDDFKSAFETNVEGTRNVLNLCHKMKKLEVYVHVSTAYCNSDQTVIEEKVYPPPASIEDAYRFTGENHTESEIVEFLKKYRRPNAYSFTKALGEHLVSENHGNIPVVIIRPSIVTPSKDEPVKGWVDNWFGATAPLAMIAKGVCRVLHADGSRIIDLIPVDYVCNLTLVAAARTKRKSEVAVYNSCSGSSNPITIKQLKDLYCESAVKKNFNDLPYPKMMVLTRRYWLVWLITTLSYIIAYLADVIARLTMKRPRYAKLIAKMSIINHTISFFMLNSWNMKTDRSTALFETLSPSDANTFPFLATDITWTEYIPTYVEGVRKFLIEKEEK